jgi:hypothetical protein
MGLFGERGGTRTLDPMIKSHWRCCAGLTSMIDGGERYFDVFFTSLSISRHVINST